MSDKNNLETRVQMLEDILAIQTLKHTYLNACDAKDVPALISTFVESDCLIDYGSVGVFQDRQDLEKLLLNHNQLNVFTEVACHDYMLESHHASNPVIEIEDQINAVGSWSLTYTLINTQDSSVVTLQGHYADTYIKTQDKWLIKETVFRLKSTLQLKIEEDLLKVIFAG